MRSKGARIVDFALTEHEVPVEEGAEGAEGAEDTENADNAEGEARADSQEGVVVSVDTDGDTSIKRLLEAAEADVDPDESDDDSDDDADDGQDNGEE